MRLVMKRGAGLFYRRDPRYRKSKTKYKLRDPQLIIEKTDDLDETLEGKGSDPLLNETTERKSISYWLEKPDYNLCSLECKPMLDKLAKECSMEIESDNESVDKEDLMEKPKESDNESVDKEDLMEKPKELQTTGEKRKYSPSVIDFLVNNNSSNSKVAAPSRSDSSMSDVNDFNTQLSNQSKERMDHCSLIKIPPKKRKRYPQKICIHCRQNHGVRKDTRYICTLCDVALCKEPCFAEYHCNK